jgi:hypothetical protein
VAEYRRNTLFQIRQILDPNNVKFRSRSPFSRSRAFQIDCGWQEVGYLLLQIDELSAEKSAGV